MRSRISGKVKISLNLSEDDHGVLLSAPLFEWVMENLTKNAVDAMGGEGLLTITTGTEKGKVWIDVADTGKGIARKNFKTCFRRATPQKNVAGDSGSRSCSASSKTTTAAKSTSKTPSSAKAPPSASSSPPA